MTQWVIRLTPCAHHALLQQVVAIAYPVAAIRPEAPAKGSLPQRWNKRKIWCSDNDGIWLWVPYNLAYPARLINDIERCWVKSRNPGIPNAKKILLLSGELELRLVIFSCVGEWQHSSIVRQNSWFWEVCSCQETPRHQIGLDQKMI